MNVPRLIVGLYPPGIRDRWGDEMTREVAATGPRSWVDTVMGAVRLWVHPSHWPEGRAGQTRHVLAVLLVACTVLTGLAVRATGLPSTTLTADPAHPATSAWLVLILLGAALAVPLPPLLPAELGRLVTVTARTLAAPLLACAAMYLAAQSDLFDHPGTALDVLLTGYYWATLCFIGLRACTLMSRIGRIATMPGTGRLCSALLLVGAGLVVAAGQSLTADLRAGLPIGTLMLSSGLGALGAVAIMTGRDLHDSRRRPAGS